MKVFEELNRPLVSIRDSNFSMSEINLQQQNFLEM
jgi:hypothetical protein